MLIDRPVPPRRAPARIRGRLSIGLSFRLSFARVDGAHAIEDQAARHAQLLGIPRAQRCKPPRGCRWSVPHEPG
jgi:hypothetical protein